MRDDAFKEKVGQFSARDIGRTAKERKTGSLGYSEAMLIAYNKKLKVPLKWSNLYKKKIDFSDKNDSFESMGDEDDNINEE